MKKKETIAEKPDYMVLALSFCSDDLVTFYLNQIKKENDTNALAAYELNAALRAENAELREALELIADKDYQAISQIKDIARRALEAK